MTDIIQKPKKSTYDPEYYQKNKIKMRASLNKWKAKNPDYTLKYKDNWRDHKEARAEYMKEYQFRNWYCISCDKDVRRLNKHKHEKTAYHLKRLPKDI